MKVYLSRILKDPSWVFRKAVLWARSYKQLNRDDIVLAFFPKTGSTWVRIFLYHLLEKRASESFTFDDINRVMPEWGHKSLFEPWPHKDTPKLVKTHRPRNPLIRTKKAVLFTRDPRDTMLSYLHYANAKREYNFSGNLEDLLLHPEMGADAYLKFHESWLPHVGLIIRYEDLRSDPVATFSKLLTYIGIHASCSEIEMALEAASLENTRTAQSRSSQEFREKFDKSFVFARSGSIGEGAAKFDDEAEKILTKKIQSWEFDLYQ